jgi:hypothetical protein
MSEGPKPAPQAPALPEDEAALWAAMQRGLAERKELLTQQLQHIQVLRQEKQGALEPKRPMSGCVVGPAY